MAKHNEGAENCGSDRIYLGWRGQWQYIASVVEHSPRWQNRSSVRTQLGSRGGSRVAVHTLRNDRTQPGSSLCNVT